MKPEERWEIDTAKSSLCFALRHIVLSEIRGRFARWGGELVLVPGDFSVSKVRVWIDTASIDTESAERDAQLRSPEFLDVERFPRAEFRTTGVKRSNEREAVLAGQLQLHGVTHPVEVMVRAQRSWVGGEGAPHATYSVEGMLNRQTFGLHWNQDLDLGGVVVGDKVELKAHVEVVRGPALAAAHHEVEKGISGLV